MYIITTFSDKWARFGKKTTIKDNQTLRRGLLTPYPGKWHNKDNLPVWSPTLFNGNRCQANAETVNFLVFDIDDGLTKFETWKLFSKYDVYAHTSFSNTEEHNKYRIILPLAKPVPANDWPRAATAAAMIWTNTVGTGAPDMKALKDRARIYYRYAIPTTPGAKQMSDYSLSGTLLDLKYDHIKAHVYVPPKNLPGQQTINQCLVYPDNRVDIYRVLKQYQQQIIFVGLPKKSTEMEENEEIHLPRVVRRILCPNCGNFSVYYYIDLNFGKEDQKIPSYHRYRLPRCNHLEKCGWIGSFQQLLDQEKNDKN